MNIDDKNDLRGEGAVHEKIEGMSSLDKRHRSFVLAYFKSSNGGMYNGTQAYKSVYGDHIDDTVACANASRLLRHAKVKAVINRIFEKAIESLSKEEWLAEVRNRTLNCKRDSDFFKGMELFGKARNYIKDSNETSVTVVQQNDLKEARKRAVERRKLLRDNNLQT